MNISHDTGDLPNPCIKILQMLIDAWRGAGRILGNFQQRQKHHVDASCSSSTTTTDNDDDDNNNNHNNHNNYCNNVMYL